MKRLSLLPAVLLLVSCSSLSTSASLEEQLQNPLTAERYYDELTDHMVNLVLQESPLTKDEATRETIDRARKEALAKAKEANQKQLEGTSGFFVSDEGLAQGEVLLVDKTLFLGPDFSATPSPDLRLYLSTVLDPRDGTFPDASAVELGPLQTVYGAARYLLPPSAAENPSQLRVAVLYDAALKQVQAFAQLQE